MSRELVPEIHDIGKLADAESLNRDKEITLKFSSTHPFKDEEGNPYNFGEIGLQEPNNLSWVGVQNHHIKGTSNILSQGQCPEHLRTLSFDERSKLFLLCLADHFSSAVSRTVADELKRLMEVSSNKQPLEKLWNSNYKGVLDLPINNKGALKEALDVVNSKPEDFMNQNQYKCALPTTPEDKMPLLNLTTLHTHCELVAKIYRFLDDVVEKDEKNNKLVYAGKGVHTINDAEKQWIFNLVRCHLFFPHRPARARDLYVFCLQYSLADDIKQCVNLLLNTYDTMWFVFSKDVDVKAELSKKLGKFLEYGFFCEFCVQDFQLALSSSPLIGPNYTQISPYDWKSLYAKEIEDEAEPLQPPLCDICQMRKGDPVEQRDEEGVSLVEYLCRKCREIRSGGKRFDKLNEWEKDDFRIAWVRIFLDAELMEKKISELFWKRTEELIKEENKKEEIQKNFRNPSLLADFVKDYHAFVKEFAKEIAKGLGIDNLGDERARESIMFLSEKYRDFFVLKLPPEQPGQFVEEIVDVFFKKFRSKEVGFLECLENSPIKLRISVSKVKYPFFEHWDFLKEDGEIVKLMRPPAVKVELNSSRFNSLKKMKLLHDKRRRFLHKLAEIESATKSLLLVRSELMENRDTREISELKKCLREGDLSGELPFNTVLNYYRIIGWE